MYDNCIAVLPCQHTYTLVKTNTLTTTFRTWLTVKQMIITGCQDENAIAQLADVKNPKCLYYIRQEVANCCVNRLKNSLKMLLELVTTG
ncbi:hypothetical protein MEN41_18405 [Dolichospermum sp. ST_con]|nr:hypothetical protein [Dolichospermum sp. ST_con]MDD1417597.1 hypothetical protein [Dolichospermum sp. ST_sed1]MDD1427007.1 hypothetical protein [Dolichospermum sp. ST_sed9]MDD1433571.1 hypothetical protein [Dolichospermum sp. ST_sed6]MDD1436746.1 hypothetical protein [Dolichospermum sp. ST_sed10]MDD1442864.1 hypothetical protein [Dolichospermum sp. ST_sed3]MDD1448567.1 hypothetical protein [Dolichospermum sp. ST_sed8]MDD1457093.1 hypothetical protein [Dolichospermum sp. ST_sed7]MDD146262